MPAPLIVSCGAPAGIGPEIAAKAWDALRDVIPFVWLGDPAHLPVGTPFQVISDMADTAGMRDAMPVMSIPFAAAAVPGKPDLSNAEGVIAAIRRGVELVQVDEASALCTAPINKKVLIDGAGFHYPGHTEFLEALTGSGRAVMMLASDRLRVVPATIHIALEDVPEVLTHALLRETIQITAIDLTRRFGIDDPRIAVAGLHPHAGEGGMMGTEDDALIAPLIRLMTPADQQDARLTSETLRFSMSLTGPSFQMPQYDLDALRPGDGVFVEGDWARLQHPLLIISGRLCASAKQQEEGFVLKSDLDRIQTPEIPMTEITDV